jgi:Tol biopolymer transport system component
VKSGSLERLTTQGTDNERPEWSPDGKRVLFRSNREGLNAIFWQMADGSAPAERLTPTLTVPAQEAVLSPDGKTLLYRVDTQNQARDLFTMPMDGTKKAKEYLATQFDELAARISPDGRWATYVSSESGRDEVYVRPFPGTGGRVLVSSGGGDEPLWARDGRHILYRAGTDVVSAAVSFGAEPAVTSRDTVARGPFLTQRFHADYDISPASGQLLMLEPVSKSVEPTIILNWAAALAQRLGPVR